jgi:single-stranded-DNA-specific exonuclease
VPERDPGAFALINPHQPGCGFPFKGLASVGVAFYLAASLRTRLRAAGREAPDPRALLDLVAVGTIADLAPLSDENRVLVSAGLRELGRSARPGLRALVEAAGIDLSRGATTGHVSFKIAPRLNAPGRLGHAERALELLLATDALGALDAARACEESNTLRRALQDQVYAEAVALAEADLERAPRAALVVAGDGWPHGVVGIVAAKLVDRYRLPAVAVALDGASGRGSARTPPGLHLYRALAACGSLLDRFGGHAAAAGLTVARDRLDAFREAFDAEARRARGEAPAAAQPAEAEVDLDDVDERLAEELSRLGPFGMGNPEPLLETVAYVERSRVVGDGHLQLSLRSGLLARDAIAFRLAARDPGAGARVRAQFIPEIDWYRGEKRLRLRVQSLEPES